MNESDNKQLILAGLKRHNYPNIHGIDVDRLSDVLSPENRSFLLSWFFKQFCHEEPIDGLSEDNLCEFLSAYGFCQVSEAKKFVKGVLNEAEDLFIFTRIVYNMPEEKLETDEIVVIPTDHMVLELVNKDLNVFKCYGNLKIYGDKEKKMKLAKLNEYEGKLQQDSFNKTGDSNKVLKTNIILQQLETLREKINVLNADLIQLLRYKPCEDASVVSKPEDIENIVDFNGSLTTLNKHVKHIEAIASFPQEFQGANIATQSDTLCQIMNELEMLSAELNN